jgi:sterol desaturase/sphingolipid hydroxylase (fatty acid hydroxylase superfamily)
LCHDDDDVDDDDDDDDDDDNETDDNVDGRFIHPVEAFGYYCILYSPCWAIPMHVGSFLVYMSILGIFGILDHCGVRFHIPGVYNTEDHDAHHSKRGCNYGTVELRVHVPGGLDKLEIDVYLMIP